MTATAIRADLGRVSGQGGRVTRRLCAGVHDQPAADRGAVGDRHAAPLLEREQDPLAGGAAGEDAVGAVLGEEGGERPDGLLVDPLAVVGERRHCRHDQRRSFEGPGQGGHARRVASRLVAGQRRALGCPPP